MCRLAAFKIIHCRRGDRCGLMIWSCQRFEVFAFYGLGDDGPSNIGNWKIQIIPRHAKNYMILEDYVYFPLFQRLDIIFLNL